MIEVKHLTKKYGGHLALNDLSFTVEDGKIYGLLGPNGAGKSTCMNIMTGYIAATEGEVKINGLDIVKDAEKAKKHIGYLPEIPPLYPDMKVREYLEFAAELKKVEKGVRNQEIDDVMGKTFISDMQNKLIKNLSKGYKQRVGLAQAMLGNPSVIILDEPTVGLDPKQILEIRDLILKLKKEHTVILSSHILSEVSAVCDEIMIISKGKMVACDTADGLSRLMKGEDELEVEIKGAESDIGRVLSKIDGIRTFETKMNKSNGLVQCSIMVGKGCDIREELFYKMAEEKCPIYEIKLNVKSLEEIFLELTAAEGSIAAVKTKADMNTDVEDALEETMEYVEAESKEEV